MFVKIIKKLVIVDLEVIIYFDSYFLGDYLFLRSSFFFKIIDSCKFVHDRGDYKSGWQLDKEWELQQYGKQSMIYFSSSLK